MPATRADKESRRLILQRVMTPRVGVVKGDRPAHGIAEVYLASDQVVPARCVGVLEIGHEDIGTAIECVDHHFAVGRAGDLDTAILDVTRESRDTPLSVADRLGLGKKIGFPPGIETALEL